MLWRGEECPGLMEEISDMDLAQYGSFTSPFSSGLEELFEPGSFLLGDERLTEQKSEESVKVEVEEVRVKEEHSYSSSSDTDMSYPGSPFSSILMSGELGRRVRRRDKEEEE